MAPLEDYNGEKNVPITKKLMKTIIAGATEKELDIIFSTSFDARGKNHNTKQKKQIAFIKKQLKVKLSLKILPDDFKVRCHELINENDLKIEKNIQGRIYYEDFNLYVNNTNIVLEALSLVENGSVSFEEGKTNFHTINNHTIGKSILSTPYEVESIEPHSGVKIGKRGRTYFQEPYLHKSQNIDAIQNIKNIKTAISKRGQKIALYDNVFRPIYNALQCDIDIKRDVIRLLTNIDDYIICEFDTPHPRRILNFRNNRYCNVYEDNHRGALYLYENCPV